MSCEAVKMYLNCVEGWVRAVEVFVDEVYAQARRDHCYEADQEDADDGSCGRSVGVPGTSACGNDTFFPAVDFEVWGGCDW